MRILTLDIETSPNIAHVWGMHKQNVALSQLIEPTEMLSFAAKWHDKRRVQFFSQFHNGVDEMRENAHRLLDEADVVVTYNGKKFDIPHLSRELILGGYGPPSPYRQVDLYQVVKSTFRFSSNKLDHVVRQLGIGGKVSHAGHELWVKCLAGDEKAWNTMRRYNIGDVRITEALHDELLPWITAYPNRNLFGAQNVCPRCGAKGEIIKRGKRTTTLGVFQQYFCNACGGWMRSGERLDGVDIRPI